MLNTRIADEENYIDPVPLQYYMMLEAQDLEILRSKEDAERNNENQIIAEQVIIDRTNASIITGDTEKVELSNDIIALNLAVRRARLNKDDERIAQLQSEIADKNTKIADINSRNNSLQTEIVKHTNVLKSLNELKSNLASKTQS